jgi:hypothetical protein
VVSDGAGGNPEELGKDRVEELEEGPKDRLEEELGKDRLEDVRLLKEYLDEDDGCDPDRISEEDP